MYNLEPGYGEDSEAYQAHWAEVEAWGCSPDEIEQIREMARSTEYIFNYGPIGISGHAGWLSATPELLLAKGAPEAEMQSQASAPPLLALDLDGVVNGIPYIECISYRPSSDPRPVDEIYRETASHYVDIKTGLVQPTRIAELQARFAAAWQRLQWELERLATDQQLEGWMLATWFEIWRGNGRNTDAAIQRWRRMQYRKTPLSDSVDIWNMRWTWEDVRSHIYGGLPTPQAAPRVWKFLHDSIKLPYTLCISQISGLVSILENRSPCLDMIRDFESVMDVYVNRPGFAGGWVT